MEKLIEYEVYRILMYSLMATFEIMIGHRAIKYVKLYITFS